MAEARRALAKAAIGAILVAALLLAPLLGDWVTLLSPDRLQTLLAEAGPFAPLALIGLMAAAVVVSPLPSLPLDIAAGALFGPLLGTLYAVAGALLGACTSFWIARLLGRELIARWLGGHISLCPTCSDRLLVRVIFLSRLVPFVSFDLVSYGAGLTAMSLGAFALASGLGMIPLSFLYVWFGSALRFPPSIVIPLGLATVTLFFLLPRWIEQHDLLGLARYFRHEGA